VLGAQAEHLATNQEAGSSNLSGRTIFQGEIGFELQGPIAERAKLIEAVLEIGKEFGLRRLGARNLMINHLEAG
jgi:vanillate/3-O-methylgallate O-demethylase